MGKSLGTPKKVDDSLMPGVQRPVAQVQSEPVKDVVAQEDVQPQEQQVQERVQEEQVQSEPKAEPEVEVPAALSGADDVVVSDIQSGGVTSQRRSRF